MLPKEFLLGAASAAYQVEGNNTKSDLWLMEQMPHTTFSERSGDACDHYNRYEEDIELLAAAGLNTYRFSLEWGRIEPEEGVFDDAEVEHYRDVIRCCRAHGVEPVVTLHHFSSPIWLIRKGGWDAETTPADFERYTRYVMEHLGSELTYVCTINEANMGLQIARIAERYTQQAKAAAAAMAAAREAAGSDGAVDESQVQMGLNLQKMMENQQLQKAENAEAFGTENPQVFQSARSRHSDEIVCEAHRLARAAIRDLCPQVKVGLTLSLHDLQPQPGGEEYAASEWADEFTHYLPTIEGDDFLGVQNYTRTLVGAQGDLPVPEGAKTTQMGYEFYPEALEHVIRAVAQEFHGDLIVTENGIATDDDTRRVEFIDRALAGVERCLADGIPVKGYCYWSLMDNFEWQKGYSMCFGLIACDRATQVRTPKPSLAHLGSYVKKPLG